MSREMTLLDQAELLFEQNSGNQHIEVWQQRALRWLNINAIEQSRIDLDQPGQLVSPVSHALMASQLFMNPPKKVLLAGLGGGAIARYLHALDPMMQGDAIEINDTVAMLAQRHFFFPASGWNIIVEDFKKWRGEHYDFAVINIADDDRTPTWLSNKSVLLRLKEQLSPGGAVAINLLVDDAEVLIRNLVALRSVFSRRTVCLSVPDFRNIVVFAFSEQPRYHSEKALRQRAQMMSGSWGIEFEPILDRLLKENPAGSGVL